MKKLVALLKRLILGFIFLYGFNIIAMNFNFMIPINCITILFVSIFGFSALFSLTFLLILVF